MKEELKFSEIIRFPIMAPPPPPIDSDMIPGRDWAPGTV